MLQPWSVFSGSISSFEDFFFASNHDFSHSTLALKSCLIGVRNIPSEEIVNIEVLDEVLHLPEPLVTCLGVISRSLPFIVRVIDTVALLVRFQHGWRDQLHVGEGLWKRWRRVHVPVGAPIADQETGEIVGLESSVPLSLQVVLVDLPR